MLLLFSSQINRIIACIHHFQPLMRLGQISNGARQARIDLLVHQCQSTVGRRSFHRVDLLLKHLLEHPLSHRLLASRFVPLLKHANSDIMCRTIRSIWSRR